MDWNNIVHDVGVDVLELLGPSECSVVRALEKRGGTGIRLGPKTEVDLSTRTGYF